MKTESGNYFQQGINEYITRYNSGELYCLRSLDERFPVSNEDLNRITAICNEEQIYSFLFRDRLGGREYTVEDARSFIVWAKGCWEKQQAFFFLVRDPQGDIAACIDISSDDLCGSPIGYWAASKARGIMTNCVLKLSELAARAGYKILFALVEPENSKSADVLVRAGFTHTGTQLEKLRFMNASVGTQKLFERYEKELKYGLSAER